MGEELISPAAEDRISIIVPFYNAESTLETCVQSVLLQTWDNWELLLVDDGSADGSPDLADTLADSDGRIRVRHTENHGVSRARNEGLKMAGGRYVTFLDADDRMAPDMLKKLHAVIIKSGAEIAGCSFHTFTDFKAQPPEETEEQEEGKEAVMDGTMFVRRRLLRGDTRIWSKLFLREKLGRRTVPRGYDDRGGHAVPAFVHGELHEGGCDPGPPVLLLRQPEGRHGKALHTGLYGPDPLLGRGSVEDTHEHAAASEGRGHRRTPCRGALYHGHARRGQDRGAAGLRTPEVRRLYKDHPGEGEGSPEGHRHDGGTPGGIRPEVGPVPSVPFGVL
jgi:hypothetical protein